jgi:hypothetical protein
MLVTVPHDLSDNRRTPNPKAVGSLSQVMLMAALARRGYAVLVPFGDNERYDFVIEVHGRFSRVQAKTGTVLKGGAVAFPTCSTYFHRHGTTRGYTGEIEFFGVYVPELNQCYLVPFEDVKTCRRLARLRLCAARNGQVKRVRFAAAYRL